MPTSYFIDAALGSDSNAGTSAGAGNAWATIGKFCSTAAGGDTCNVKASATYTITAQLVPPSGTAQAPTIISGYTTTPGDGGQITVSTSSAIFLFAATQNHVHYYNVIADGTGNGTRCWQLNAASNVQCINCVAKRFTAYGFMLGTGCRLVNCRATGGAGQVGYYLASGASAYGCVADANACPGFGMIDGSAGSCTACIAAGNTGASSDGFQISGGSPTFIINCTSYGNGRDGIRFGAATEAVEALVLGCILAGNGGYGLNNAGTALADTVSDYNAYRSNTSGARNGFPAGAHDVTLTGDPFVSAAGNNFALNNTAGAGAACRAANYPGAFQGLSTTGYEDIGASQHQDSGGAAGMLWVPSLEGV